MGALVADGYVPNVQEQLNRRFIGEALEEMVKLQAEFKVFSSKHSLRDTAILLGIAPVEDKNRDGFLTYVDRLRKVGATVNGKATKLNGHDQIVASLRKNLESASPMPVNFTYHPSGGEKGTVEITTAPAFSFSRTQFLVISVPTVPADRPKAADRKNK